MEKKATHTRERENINVTTSRLKNKTNILEKELNAVKETLKTSVTNILQTIASNAEQIMGQFEALKSNPPEAIIQNSKIWRMSSLTASNNTSPSKQTQDQVYDAPQQAATPYYDEDQAQKKIYTTPATTNMSMEEDLESRLDDDPEKVLIV